MMTAFYKQKPVEDTPYRQLMLERAPEGHGWQVRLSGGTKWGRENRQELNLIPATNFKEAQESYDRVFVELQDEGWRAYSPSQVW